MAEEKVYAVVRTVDDNSWEETEWNLTSNMLWAGLFMDKSNRLCLRADKPAIVHCEDGPAIRYINDDSRKNSTEYYLMGKSTSESVILEKKKATMLDSGIGWGVAAAGLVVAALFGTKSVEKSKEKPVMAKHVAEAKEVSVTSAASVRK